jgi:hypothetical protein
MVDLVVWEEDNLVVWEEDTGRVAWRVAGSPGKFARGVAGRSVVS